MKTYCPFHQRFERTYYFVSYMEYCDICEHTTVLYAVIPADRSRVFAQHVGSKLNIIHIYDA